MDDSHPASGLAKMALLTMAAVYEMVPRPIVPRGLPIQCPGKNRGIDRSDVSD